MNVRFWLGRLSGRRRIERIVRVQLDMREAEFARQMRSAL